MALGDSSPIGQLNKQQAQAAPEKQSFSLDALASTPTAVRKDISLADVAVPQHTATVIHHRLDIHKKIFVCVVLFVLLLI